MTDLERLVNKRIEKEEEKVKDIISSLDGDFYCCEYYFFCDDKFRKSNLRNGYSYEIQKIRNDPNTKDEFIKYILDRKESKIARLKTFLHTNCNKVDKDLKQYCQNIDKIKKLENKNKIIKTKYNGILEELLYLKKNREYPLLEEMEKLESNFQKLYIKSIENNISHKRKCILTVVKAMNEIYEMKKNYISKSLENNSKLKELKETYKKTYIDVESIVKTKAENSF